MFITREIMIKKLADKSGYYQRDIRALLHCLDDVVLDCFNEVEENEEISLQFVKGIKVGCKVVEARDRVDPRTQEPIVVPATIKPFAKFSQDFREAIQAQYDAKKDG